MSAALRLVGAVGLGVGVGLAVPLPGWRAAPTAAPVPAPAPDVPVATEPDGAATAAAQSLEAYLEAYAAFTRAWGTPLAPPPGWDADAEAARLDALAAPFEAARTSCDVFPCVVALASREPLAREALAATFGVDPARIALGQAADVDRDVTVYTAEVVILDQEPPDAETQRWVRRTRQRAARALAPEVEALVGP
ncbi:MAG: hypothetical protein R3F59_17655 [Myxococcota bacterium]